MLYLNMRHQTIIAATLAVLLAGTSFAKDYHVSPKGNDKWSGTAGKPWKTLGYAFSRIQSEPDDCRLLVMDGEYKLDKTLSLDGIKGRRLTVEAAPGASPVIRGDRKLSGFKVYKGKIMVTSLKAAGIKDYGNTCQRSGLVDLYWKGERQRLARYPDDGFIYSGKALGETSADGISYKEGVFEYKDDRVSSWASEKDPYIFGYFRWDWSDQYQKAASIDIGKKTVTLGEPWHHYGYKDGFRYYGLNLLCELDSPGEYYIDRDKGILYWYPPEGYSEGDEVTISLFGGEFMLSLQDCDGVTVRDLSFVGGRENAIDVSGSGNIVLDAVEVSRFGGDALHVASSKDVKVEGCRFSTLGHSGIRMYGGDRKTLEPSGYSVTNTVIRDFSLFKHTYEPAVYFKGCGLTVAHCDFSGSTSSAMRIDGSEALVEFNHFHDLVRESDDQGGIDMFYNYGYRGVVIRYNLWEDIIGGSLCGAAGVRFDDMISGQTVYGNVFRNVGAVNFGAVQIHGGKDNLVENNVFYRCRFGVSFSPWSQEGWDGALEREEVRTQLHSDIDIDGPLYTGRYPDLRKDIHGNVNRNMIRNNLAVGCYKMFNDERGVNVLQNNSALFMGESAEKCKSLEYYLSPEVLEEYGLKPIPWKEIGPRP